MNDAPDAPLSDDGFPEGWQLGAESWTFHRQFFARLGRPAAQGEYAAIISQIRYRLAPRLDRYHYQATLLDGSPLIVRGGWHRLIGVEPADWSPPKAPPSPALQPTRPIPPASAPPLASPPPRQPLRASTLTLGNPTAARAAAERLRRAGISAGRTAS